MKNHRNTVAKTSILNLLNNSSVALSHAEIQKQLNGLCDRVTIYRVLNRLISENLIHKVINLDGQIKYAACHLCSFAEKEPHTHGHVHFCCEKCNCVTCLENVEPNFQLPKNYRVTEMNFILSGICPNCMNTKK